jgi:hypothetical protein
MATEEKVADQYLHFPTPFGNVSVEPRDVYLIETEENRLDQVKRERTEPDGTIVTLYVNFTVTQVPAP